MLLGSGTLPFGHRYGDGSQSKAQVWSSQHTLYGRDNVVFHIDTTLRSGMPTIVVRFSTCPRYLPLFQKVRTSTVIPTCLKFSVRQGPLQWGVKRPGVKLTTHVYLVPVLRYMTHACTRSYVLFYLCIYTSYAFNICNVLHRLHRQVISSNIYTGCPRRNVPDFGRVFLMLKYTDVTQNTYVKS